MKKVYLIGALLSFGLLAEAQSFMRFEDKAFNFGAKVGFNATFPVINSLSINGKEAEIAEEDAPFFPQAYMRSDPGPHPWM